MLLSDSSNSTWVSTIASAADLCLKPWLHAVVLSDINGLQENQTDLMQALVDDQPIDLLLRIECRNREGDRQPERDLELEIYRSGDQLNLMLSWSNQPDMPLLWQGLHPVWMDGSTGSRCSSPKDASPIEAFARRLRSLFVLSEEN